MLFLTMAYITGEEVWTQLDVVPPIFRIPKKKRILSTTIADESALRDVSIHAQIFFE